MYADGPDETSSLARGGVASRVAASADAVMRAQRGTLLHWVPVFMAIGIGMWFGLRWEPEARHYAGLAVLAATALVIARRAGEALSPLLVALALVAAGACVAGARAHLVAAPVLDFRYYGPIEGRVVGLDRSASGAVRMTLDRVRLDDVSPAKVPARIRLSLHGPQGWVALQPGLTVMLTGHLGPPGGPVEPGGFDFARKAWFDGLGAVGYTRTPVLPAAMPKGGLALMVFRARIALSRAVQEALPGPRGAFAAAILTGDRSAIPADALQDLRDANLAHLLAISGLHMGLLTGVVFAVFRGGLALVPPLALRLPGKKIAASAALVAGAIYLALSGGNVATVRAFIMVSVVLVAVLLDRKAISLRSVAIAATLVLILTPEALAGPGFQMSFAATVALVAAFGAVRDWTGPRLPRWAMPVGTVFFSSLVAGLATAPFAAAHFNRFTDYGLIANLLSVPMMGAVVMPFAVAAAFLAPLGLGWIALQGMGLGLSWILGVAERIAALEGAITPIVAPPGLVLPLLALSALWVLLWQGGLRWLGVAPLCLAFAVWSVAERPSVLISSTGSLLGVMGPEGRVLSKPRGDSFAARLWLENDGDRATQEEAAERPGLPGTREERRFEVGGLRIAHVTGRGRAERAASACDGDLLIVNAVLPERPAGPCRVIDPGTLRETGALAIVMHNGAARIVTARDRSGIRLWTAR